MVSNFLGDVGSPHAASAIISASELIAREGVNLQKGMNFRDTGPLLSVFLVLPREGGYTDEWNEEAGVYVYEGHDSTTVESGKSVDQLMMYESGKLTDNGKFYKAANAFKDGIRKERPSVERGSTEASGPNVPLQVQVYEKLDAGVWYDKGIFNLIDAKHIAKDGGKVFKFYLTLADAEFYAADDPDRRERMLSSATKLAVWERDRGRCAVCETQSGLRFISVSGGGMQLRCALHGGKTGGGLLG